ncbi:MAG: hypothetical protein FJX99_01555, partial [Bacteroidetes bacterium]|nr:hypothetical protein [Bacteroidota bacterium]
MKILRSFVIIFLFAISFQQLFAQTGCLGADPFCTGPSFNFPNSTNVADLGAVDCLGSTPNPAWYYMEIDAAGTMTFNISQTTASGSGLDVDFIIWGPFSSLSAACAGANPFPAGSAVDCSYSTAATETATIPNAQVGQVYVALITNFSDQAGNISFTQTGGSGSADCSFTCGVALTATPSACNNNTYSVSGNLTVTSGPGISIPNSGTVTIANSCGGSQTFNAPFTNIPYNFTGLTANGAGCVITATFSNFANCNTVQNYTAPASCVTPCSVTSVTATPTACSANQYNISGQISFTNPPATGTLTVTGSCGGTQTFNAPFTSPLNYSFSNLTANGAACSVTATFSENTSCTNTGNYTAPQSCNCSVTGITATPTACSANQFSLNGNVSFTNPPATGTLTVSSSCGGTQTFNAPFTSPLAYSLSGLPANGAGCTVTATFSANTSCTLTQNFTAPSSCNCSISGITATPTACSNNQYAVGGNISFANAPATGTLTISGSCGGTQTFNAPFTSPQAYNLTGLTANGAGCTVTATFSANTSCTLTQNYSAPASCGTNGCNISAINTAMANAGFQPLNVSGFPCALYFYNPNTTNSWNTAQSQANAVGATLLTVCSLAENNAVWNAAQAAGITGGLWIGYTDQVSEGNWVWQDGSTCTFTNWNPGEPNNSSCFPSNDGEDAAVIQMSNGRWNDVYLGPTGACFNPAAYASLIKINLCPQVTATATPTPVCIGSPVQLSATTILGSNPFNYTWTTTGNVPIGTGSPLSYQPTGNTTATVVSTDLYGCTASATVNITTQSCNTNNCVTEPFCTSNTYTFPAGVNQTDASITYPGNNYNCLASSPNPAWYYMEIDQPGTLDINMTNSSGVDIDFILWGPYTSYANAMTYCNNFLTATSGSNINTVIDCSFSTAATETANIANAQTGEVYVLLITNFSNTATNITFNGSGTATTDCSIVTPTCNFTGITGTVSACNGTNNTYSINGTVSYTDPPTTGTLTLTNSCGGTQTFNAPFGSTQNYTFSGLNANGIGCTITANFSADPSCTATLTYTAPPSCTCPAEVGTYTTNVSGNSNSMNMLCYGDQIDVTSNNNWTPPAEIIGATDPNSPFYDANAPVYDPGIAWLVYACPPSVALTPAQSATSGLGIPDDPCLLGVVAGTPDITDVNDLSLINAFPAGTFTNNTVYLVPLTMYSVQDGIYSYVILPAQDCYELGTPIVVQYLPQVTFTQTQNCANGTVIATISGGAAQLNGTNFTVVSGSLTPTTAQAINTTTNNGGSITIGGLQTGPYSFQVEDANGCPVTISGNYTGAETASLSYPDNLYCTTDTDPSATGVGTQGGTYSSGPGLSINATTGAIDLSASTPGAYTVTYTTPGTLCPASDSYNLTIEGNPDVDGGADLTLCPGNQITLEGQGAQNYTWNLGLINGIPYLPNIGVTEFYLTGTSNAGCVGYDTVVVTVLETCEIEDELVFWVP